MKKIGISLVLLTFLAASFPLSSFAQTSPSVSIEANGSSGSVSINSGDNYTYSWSSTSIVSGSCQMTSPVNSGIPDSGSGTIAPGNPFYPTTSSPITLSITCTGSDGSTLTNAVTVSLTTPPPPPIGTASVDLKVNGSDGPVTLPTGTTSYVYSWTSANVLSGSCWMTSPVSSGVSDSGTNTALSGSPFFPLSGGSITISITCTGLDGSAPTDSVTVSLATPPPPPIGPVGISVALIANPTSVSAGATSTLTWTTTGDVVSCSAPWTLSTAVSGSQDVSVATTTAYSINCTDGTATTTAQATVTATTPSGGGSCPLPTISSPLTASATVGQAFSYTLTANGTTTPVFTVDTSSLPAGLSYASSTETISGTPTTDGTFTIALTSTTPCGTDSQNLVVTVTTATVFSGGGGGSSGSSGGGGYFSSGGGGTPTPVSNVSPLACLYLHDYMRIDLPNDPEQVTLLQIFLKTMEHDDYVTVNGVFDQATFIAVEAFQTKYASDILTPWGISAPTGYVYILTLRKINEIYCQSVFPLTIAQQNEISSYRALLQSLQNQGITPIMPGTSTVGTSTATSSPGILPIVGEASPPKGQNIQSLAVALLAGPPNLLAGLQCLYQWLLIVVMAYIIGDIMKDVLYKDLEENVLKRFMAKWITISVVLILATILAFIFKDWCLILPLLISLLVSILWMSLYPKHLSLRASFKSWYLVLLARAKTIRKEVRPVEKPLENQPTIPTILILPTAPLLTPEDASEKVSKESEQPKK